MQTEILTVPLGGLDERAAPAPGSASAVVNMTFAGTWRSAPGLETLVELGASPRALGSFTTRGREALLVEYGDPGAPGTLGVIDWRDASVAFLSEERVIPGGPDLGTSFTEMGEWLYVLSEHNAPVRWNGRKVEPVGYARAPAPPEVLYLPLLMFDRAVQDSGAPNGGDFQRGIGPLIDATSGGDPGFWKYGWRMTLVNSVGSESPPSALAWVSGSGVPVLRIRHSVVLQAEVPPPGTVAVRFYRTLNRWGVSGGGEPDTYLVAEVEPAQAAWFVDDVSDEDLGALCPLDELGAVPTGIFRVARVGGQTIAMTPSEVYLSAPLRVEQWPTSGRIPCGSGDGGRFTALVSTRGAVLIFRESAIYAILQSGEGTLAVATVSETLGTRAGSAVLDVPGAGVVFPGEDGLYVVIQSPEGGLPTVAPFGTNFTRRTWRRVARAHLPAARAHLNVAEGEAWWALPHGGDATPTLGLVFHYGSGLWSVRERYATGCFAASQGETFIGAAEADVVARLTRAVEQTRSCYWRSVAIYSQDQRELHNVRLALMPGGRNTVTVAVRRNGKVDQDADDPDLESRDPYDEPDTLDVWDEGTWGGVWQDDRPVRLLASLDLKRALDYDVKVEGSSFELVGVEVEVDASAVDPKPGFGRRA